MSSVLIATDLLGTLTFRDKEGLFKDVIYRVARQLFGSVERSKLERLLKERKYNMDLVTQELAESYGEGKIAWTTIHKRFAEKLREEVADEVHRRFGATYRRLRKQGVKIALVSLVPYKEVLGHVIEEIRKRGITFDYVVAPKDLEEKRNAPLKKSQWEKLRKLIERKDDFQKVYILDDTEEFISQAREVFSDIKGIEIKLFLVGKDIEKLEEILD